MTDDQLYKFLQMSDLSEQEKRIAQQQAQANELRQSAIAPGGRGWAGGLARGLQGAMSIYQGKQANKSMDEYTKEKQKWINAMNPRGNLPIAPPAPSIDYSQYGNYGGE